VKLIRLKTLTEKVGLEKSAIYDRIAKGQFPKQISLGGRSVAWLESDIDNWIMERKNRAA
jgi:prophage regulatory protein